MGNEFEKLTDTMLADEKGAIPTSIKGLAIALDQHFTRMEKLNQERHDELINIMIGVKTSVNQDCISCRRNYDTKFILINDRLDMLKFVSFMAENPKLAIISLVGLISIMAMGFDKLFTQLKELIL